MRLLHAITEDEMIAVFLKTEINSVRFEAEILRLLQSDKTERSIVDMADLRDPAANAYRRKLFGDFRGFRRNAGMFIGFPEHVAWHRALLSRGEITQIHYIDYSYWNVLSGGSRLPTEAAKNIRDGIVVYGQSTEYYLQLAKELCQGARFPDLILTAVSPSAPLVVMEGHVRLTTYVLEPDCLPTELEVLIGFSPDFPQWGAHGNP